MFDVSGDTHVFDRIDRSDKPFVATAFAESFPVFSPDGKWIAYQSNDSSRFEIYVQPFPGPGGKVQVSTGGGARPKWSRDGRELFYRTGTRLMAVEVHSGPTFTISTPRVLFDAQYAPSYDVAADGRFLMVRDEDPSDLTQLRYVLNWSTELERVLRAR